MQVVNGDDDIGVSPNMQTPQYDAESQMWTVFASSSDVIFNYINYNILMTRGTACKDLVMGGIMSIIKGADSRAAKCNSMDDPNACFDNVEVKIASSYRRGKGEAVKCIHKARIPVKRGGFKAIFKSLTKSTISAVISVFKKDTQVPTSDAATEQPITDEPTSVEDADAVKQAREAQLAGEEPKPADDFSSEVVDFAENSNGQPIVQPADNSIVQPIAQSSEIPNAQPMTQSVGEPSGPPTSVDSVTDADTVKPEETKPVSDQNPFVTKEAQPAAAQAVSEPTVQQASEVPTPKQAPLAIEDVKPEEVKPAVEQSRIVVEDGQKATVEPTGEQALEVSTQTPEEPKPAPEEPKPASGEPKPTPEEPKPASEEPKPTPEEPKPADSAIDEAMKAAETISPLDSPAVRDD